MSKNEESKKQHVSNKEYEEWHMRNWRAWGSWFSWGSPVGLGIFFVLSAVTVWILANL